MPSDIICTTAILNTVKTGKKKENPQPMKTIDLSHTISIETPVYPGTEPPVFSTPCTIEKQGFSEKRITLFSHTGTHMDAPSHILPEGKSLDRFPAEKFMGKAAVINLTHIHRMEIEHHDLLQYEAFILKIDFLLLHTGWYLKWGTDAYFKEYPVLTAAASRWLAGFPLKGIGVDMISVDRTNTNTYPIHRIFLQNEILIVENLTNLSELPDKIFSFFCFPLKIKDADGSPVRAAALISESFFPDEA
jgi:arylformamidase